MLRARSVSDLDCFKFWNIYIYRMRYLGEYDSILNTKFIYLSYTLYAHGLKVILHKVNAF